MFSLRARTSVLRAPATRALYVRYESTEATPEASTPPSTERGARRYRKRSPEPPRPLISRTHFLSIPIYEHSPELREKVAAFRDRILASGLEGLTEDSVVPRLSHFLELRLGNLNIAGFKAVMWRQRRPYMGQPTVPTRAEQTPIPLNEILEVLQTLKAPIQEILTADGGDGALHIPLGNLRPLLHGPRTRFNADKVNILFLAPNEGPASQPLRAINELVFKRFEEAGMWVDTHRPSTLSMTLANVRYHKGKATKPYEDRVHFSVNKLYESEAFRAFGGGPAATGEGVIVDAASPRPVELGEGIAKSLHLIPIREAEPDAVSEVERAEVKQGDDDPAKPDFKLEF